MMIKHVVSAVVFGALAVAPAHAQSGGDFYKGRSIDVYIGFSPGGVYDITARMLSRHMGKYIPGNPGLVPRNMEGAGGLRLANWLYQQGPKDGTAIGTFARGAAFSALLGIPGATFEATKFNWIGSTNNEVSVCAAWTKSGVTSFQHLMEKELVVGATGPSADDQQFPKLINAILGTKMRIIGGYPGGNEIKMAIERQEVGGRCGWSWTSVKATEAQWLKDKSITILAQLSLRKHPDLPDTPSIMDFAKTDEQRQIFRVIFARQVMAWPYAAPPGVPADRVAMLRKGFDDMVKDKEFIDEAVKLGLEVTPVSGDGIQTLIADVYRTTNPETAKKIADILK